MRLYRVSFIIEEAEEDNTDVNGIKESMLEALDGYLSPEEIKSLTVEEI